MNRIQLIDDVIITKMQNKNADILHEFGDICFLLQRKSSGSVVSGTVSSYTNSTNTQFQLWEGTPGGTPNSNHPDLRFDTNDGSGSISVTKDGVELDRIPEIDTLDSSDEFKVTTDVNGSVYINLFTSGSVVEYEYDTLCYCVEPENSQGRTDCTVCYATMYEGGYDVATGYGSEYNPDGTLMVRINPAFRDTKVESVRNKREDEQTEGWTLADPNYPVFKDFDIIMPITGDHSGSVFEITNVRMSHLRNHNLSQRFQLHNLPDTDIIYEYDLPDLGVDLSYYLQFRTFDNI